VTRVTREIDYSDMAVQCPRIGFTPGFGVESSVRKSAKIVENAIRKTSLKSGNTKKVWKRKSQEKEKKKSGNRREEIKKNGRKRVKKRVENPLNLI